MSICYQSPWKPIPLSHSHSASNRRTLFTCNLSLSSAVTTEPEPVFTSVRSFAPATVANHGPGFDFLGCAVDGVGDHVTLTVDPSVHPGQIAISSITGPAAAKKLSKNRPPHL